ncbi:MAG: flagellar biosynthetic protein FliO [Nitrospirota bacterium]|nr:flagellar biosynthetic protein FliO [Nitrospirota bacterium]MDH4360588.1 flagellar biosynthetic protein FliO [Nitrospirota bacterium]MDH5574447.1 flagellar biosynthetic protein FliO [Nitrospirota bacterium]
MDLTHEALKMAGALALVVVVLLGGLAWVRRTFGEVPGKTGDPVMRILGGLRVGAGKQIMLVEIAGEVLVLGTTARELTLLTTIVDADRIHRLRSIANPVVGRLGVWLGQWNRQTSEKTVAGSFITKQPIKMSNRM